MATLFTTIMASLGVSGATAAGGSAASAASASTVSALSIASTVVGGLATIFAGAQQKHAADAAALDEEARAAQEEINGKKDALDALRALNEDQAAIAVAGYASGLGGEGSVFGAQREAAKIGDQNINMARDNSKIQSAFRRSSARELRREGRAAQSGAIFEGLTAGLRLYERRERRG